MPPPHLGGLPGDWKSTSLENTEKNTAFYTLSLNTAWMQWDRWAKLSAELTNVCVNKNQASEHWPSEDKHRLSACMCEFWTFFCVLVRPRRCQTMIINVAGSSITWTSKLSVLAKVCCISQLASCYDSWENDHFQVSPSDENAFFGIKVKKVTFTQMDVVGEPQLLETCVVPCWKEDIQEHRKSLWNKFATQHLGGLLIDSMCKMHSQTLSRCACINFQSWCSNISQQLSLSDVSLMP